MLGPALAQWTDRASATGKATARRAGGTAIGAIDAMLRRLDLLRGQVTREIRQAGDAPPRCSAVNERPVGSGWLGSLCQS